jgi:hypothetical protein
MMPGAPDDSHPRRDIGRLFERAAGVLAVAVLVGFVSVLALQTKPYPLPWILGAAALGLCYISALLGRSSVKLAAVAWTFALFCGGFAALEIVVLRGPTRAVDYSAQDQKPDPLLGYAPIRNDSVRATGTFGSTRLFDVTYTYDENGQRIARPPSMPPGEDGCVLFFGDSFTFGEGVRDAETMPFQVTLKSNNRLRAYNFGFRGYGPHQMLAAIEGGMVRRVVACRVTHAIYLAIPDHLQRASGRSPWGREGPLYELRGRDSVVHVGTFAGNGPTTAAADYPRLRAARNRSAVARQIALRLWGLDTRQPLEGEFDRWVGIVQTSQALLKKEYPLARFHVLVWDAARPVRESLGIMAIARDMAAALESRGDHVIRVSSILPDYATNSRAYLLAERGDEHPSAQAYARVAEYLANTVFSPGFAAR